jgi:hypothetical protein
MLQQLVSFFAEHDSLTQFYADHLRSSLFSGFMTLAGFLFTVKSFLIARLQQDVYGDPDYQDWIEDIGKKHTPSLTVYGSLKRLGRFLFLALCLSFATAVAQFTFGLVGQRWATWIALGMAIAAAIVFVRTLFVVRGAVKAWVDFLEQKLEKGRQKRLKERALVADQNATAPSP